MKKLALALLAGCITLSALAGTLAGVTMDNQISVGSQDLVLNGMGLRSKFFVKVYVGGLYLPGKQTDAAKVLAADEARRMVMHWLHDAGKDAVCDGWNEGLAANTSGASAELKKDFDTLCSYMADAVTGDRFVFTYVPGTGTAVELKGQAKGTIAGKPFADALLACWIGPKPGPGEDFKKHLLGG